MTRKSRREIERAVEDLGGDGTVREWVREYLAGAGDLAFEYGCDPGVDSGGNVCLTAGPEFEIHASTDDIPEWIDVEGDLPVEA